MTIAHGPSASVEVPWATMAMTWSRLTFLHWRYPAEAVQRLLPPGLTVQTYDGSAWVGLIPFEMMVRPARLPATTWLSYFPETNVRTYVTDDTGRLGIWFFSLDAARLPAVMAANAALKLPYVWSEMSVHATPGPTPIVTYRSRRRRRRWHDARGNVTVQMGEAYEASELTELDHFLTARWTLFSTRPYSLTAANTVHSPWPLRRGEVLECDQNVIEAAGLPSPVGRPLVHYSDAVAVRIGLPYRAG